MDKTQPPAPFGAAPSASGSYAGRRAARGGVRAHPLVASLAGGLQATYAPRTDDPVPDVFASLIARLDRRDPDES